MLNAAVGTRGGHPLFCLSRTHRPAAFFRLKGGHVTHQTENGYTRIADTLLDALALEDLSKRELKICLVVIRRTYGFGKREALLSAAFMAEATGMARNHIGDVVPEMVRRGILTSRRTQNGNVIGLNKRFFPVPKTGATGVPKTGASDAPKTGAKVSPKQGHKRKTFIDTSTDTPLPPNVDPALWAEFVTHRKQKRTKLTPIAEKRALAMLAKQPDPNACITQTLEAGWTGLFPLKPNGGRNGRPETPHERVQRLNGGEAARHERGTTFEGHAEAVDPDVRDLRRR